MKKIYLAGPIFQCEDHECIYWRKDAKDKLKCYEVVDPMDRDYRGKTDELYINIVEEDKALIDTCDILLVNYLRSSVGTSMEILYAWERKKTVVIVTENSHNSPWLIYHCDKICRSIDDAVQYINQSVIKF